MIGFGPLLPGSPDENLHVSELSRAKWHRGTTGRRNFWLVRAASLSFLVRFRVAGGASPVVVMVLVMINAL
jgi:hypothetical protein